EPVEVLDRDPVDERAEPLVAVGGRLVEGGLPHHVRHGQEEELALGVAAVCGGAFVRTDGRDRVELRHDGTTPFTRRVEAWEKGCPRSKSATVRSALPG